MYQTNDNSQPTAVIDRVMIGLLCGCSGCPFCRPPDTLDESDVVVCGPSYGVGLMGLLGVLGMRVSAVVPDWSDMGDVLIGDISKS